MMKPREFFSIRSTILQINEIIDEVSKSKPNDIKLIKLLRELLITLNTRTTAWACVEISEFATEVNLKYSYFKLGVVDPTYNWDTPEEIFSIILDFIDLCNYPYSPPHLIYATPKTILEKIEKYIKKENIDLNSVKTKLDQMKDMYENGTDFTDIFSRLGIPSYMLDDILYSQVVKKSLARAISSSGKV